MAKYIHEMDMSTEKVWQKEEGFSKLRIATSASTQVLTGAGLFKAVAINKRPPGTLSIYDSTSAVSSALIGVLDSSHLTGVREFNVIVTKGILVVPNVTGGDYTIIYRS